MPKKLLLLGLAIVSSILLSGCTQSSIELYVFGPAKSCYQKNTLNCAFVNLTYFINENEIYSCDMRRDCDVVSFL